MRAQIFRALPAHGNHEGRPVSARSQCKGPRLLRRDSDGKSSGGAVPDGLSASSAQSWRSLGTDTMDVLRPSSLPAFGRQRLSLMMLCFRTER